MKTYRFIATVLCLTALPALTACGSGQPDAQAPDEEEVAEEAVDDMDDAIDDVDEQVDDAQEELEEGG